MPDADTLADASELVVADEDDAEELGVAETLTLAAALSDGETEEPYDCDAVGVAVPDADTLADASELVVADEDDAEELGVAETLTLAAALSDGETEEP